MKSSDWLQKKILALHISVALACIFYGSPLEQVDVIGWNAFIIFAMTISLVIAKCYDMGAVSLIALSLLIVTNTVTLEESFLKFSYPITWLVVLAFFISRAFVISGLGTRIALGLSASVGSTPLRLAYALSFAEVCIAPLIPSNTARGGGLIVPVAQSLGENIFGKHADSKKHYRQWNAYLLYNCFQANLISSALFLTAMAGNPVIAAFAGQMGMNLTWLSWFYGAAFPGIISLLAAPIVLKFLIQPSQSIPDHLADSIQDAYRELGPFSLKEKYMSSVFLFLLIAWVLGPWLGIHPTAAALFAITMLLALEVIAWHDLATDHHAWTTFIWLTVLFTLTNLMKDHGLIAWAAKNITYFFPVMTPRSLLVVLMALNFYSHYFFASLTSHITTIFHPLMLIGLEMGVPIQPLVYGLAFSTSLSGGLTHYGTGSGTIVYGSGYWSLREWWYLGFVFSTFVLILFILLGFPLWF